MTPEQLNKTCKIIDKLIRQYKSMREFARMIREDVADVTKWRKGTRKINGRQVVVLCRLFDLNPHDLNPDIFPSDLKFVFTNKRSDK